jgi:hypothetical protein
LPTVVLVMGGFEYIMPPRIRGLLIGSKTAPLLATLPIADAVWKSKHILVADGIPLDPCAYSNAFDDDMGIKTKEKHSEQQQGGIATAWRRHWGGDSLQLYDLLQCPVSSSQDQVQLDAHVAVLNLAGNIYTFGKIPRGATESMCSIEDSLRERWPIDIQPDSREYRGVAPCVWYRAPTRYWNSNLALAL